MMKRALMLWDWLCVYCLFIRIKLKINKWGGKVGDQFWDS